jgi:hypothetical protein
LARQQQAGRAASDLLAADTGSLTTHDIAGEAIWADRIRDYQSGRERTAHWHYVDIEIGAPNVDRACFNHPALPPGVWASRGPAQDCIIDKIVQFEAELAQPDTPVPERLLALKFLLHFVGDLHQPLHAADSLDRGANTKRVSGSGFQRTMHLLRGSSTISSSARKRISIPTVPMPAISIFIFAPWATLVLAPGNSTHFVRRRNPASPSRPHWRRSVHTSMCGLSLRIQWRWPTRARRKRS